MLPEGFGRSRRYDHNLQVPLRLHAPPMTPKLITGAPSRVMKPGMIVWYGRLCGPTGSGAPASGKPVPRFCSEIPVPGTTTPEPNPCSWTGSSKPSSRRRRPRTDRPCRPRRSACAIGVALVGSISGERCLR